MSVISVKRSTVEPPISDHTKYKDLVVAYNNRTTERLFRDEGWAHLLYGR